MKKKILALCLVVALMATAIAGATLAYFTDTTQDQKNTFTMGDIEIKLDETDIEKPNERTEEDQEFGVLMPGVSYVKDPTVTVLKNSEDCYVFLEINMNKYVSLINLIGVDAYHNGIGGLKGDYPGFAKFVAALAEDNTLRAAVLDRWFVGIDHADWKVMNVDEIEALALAVAAGQNAKELCVKLGYIGELSEDGIVKKNAADVALKFMDKFQMPNTVTEEMFDGDLAYKIGDVSKSNFNTLEAPFKMIFTGHAIQSAELADIDAAYTAYFEQN